MNFSLDFRTLLMLIATIFGKREFTARDLSNAIAESYPHFPGILKRFRTKLISNDLRRLYAMGFLKRKRIKRKCRTKNGKIFFKGYEYKYSISSQGWKYLRYLAEGKRWRT